MQFHRALGRPPLPKWPKFPGASGPHRGLTAEQWASTGSPVPWEVVVLCTSSEDPARSYEALSTTIDTHGALDLLDIAEVKESWSHAARRNASERSDGH